jgi:TonB family protein
MERYDSVVSRAGQRSRTASAVSFASYINQMHRRIHALFADQFLESLDELPCDHPMNDERLKVGLEMVLTPDGHLKRIGIIQPSGETDFDIAALDSVDRSQPFGETPRTIRSPDGLVYLHWEFYRDEVYACSTLGARPYVVRERPAAKRR